MASSTTPPARYTAQLAVLVTEDARAGIDRDALNRRVSLGEVVRGYIDTGAEIQSIATEYGVDVVDLVNAARLYALKLTTHAGVEQGLARS